MIDRNPTWNGRIPANVKEYLQKKGFSCGQVLMEFYKILKQQEIPEMLREREEHLKAVAQIDIKVAQATINGGTNVGFCATQELDEICKTYVQAGRLLENPDSRDKSWIDARLKKANLHHIDIKTFLDRCKELPKEVIDPDEQF